MAEVLGGLAGSVQGTVGSLVNQGTGFLDKYFPPEQRAVLWAKFNKFMTERPKLGAFLLSQIALSGVPLGLFVIMTITVALFAIIAALLIGLLGALIFIVFAIGFALIFLLPTLFFTTAVATFLFLFGLGAYYIVKWFNEKEIPGIHTDFVPGVKKQLLDGSNLSESEKVDPVTGKPPGEAEQEQQSQQQEGRPQQSKQPEKLGNKKKNKSYNNGKKQGGAGNPVGDVAKSTGLDKGPAGEVTKRANLNEGPVGDVTEKAGLNDGPVGDVTKKADLNDGPVGDVTKKVKDSPVGEVQKKADLGNATKSVNGVKDAIPGGVL